MNQPIRPSMERDGFALVQGVLDSETIAYLKRLLQSESNGARPGQRDLFRRYPAIAELATSPKVRSLVEEVLGRRALAVRALFFEKAAGTNWGTRWHQDKTIAVQQRQAVPGYRGWSLKSGIPHVQAPTSILEKMMALRLHLDPASDAEGGLWVCPGSHRLGCLSRTGVQETMARLGTVSVSAVAGDALLIKPLLLHSSNRSCGGPRRVIHLEFAAEPLSGPLRWHEDLAEKKPRQNVQDIGSFARQPEEQPQKRTNVSKQIGTIFSCKAPSN